MKNTFGQSVSVTIFGESHGQAIGAVIDGLCPGIEIDNEYISDALSKRRPSTGADTQRAEKDNFQILSGVFEGKTTGTPLAIVIPNEDTRSKDYSKMKSVARPSHADYTAECKYHGYQDYRGGGHFSGRITAAIVAAGAIMNLALKELNIKIGTHILCCGGVYDKEFSDTQNEIDLLSTMTFPVLSQCEDKMMEKILQARSDKDSVGGILQTAICGMPSGVGEPWFDSVEGILSHALFSIGGVKGVEFGAGFKMAHMRGSEANDGLYISESKVATRTNNNGGINGGITNGMPIIFNTAIKPTPSIAQKQQTVNFEAKTNTDIEIEGRHDPAIVRRACPVVNAISAICMCDLLAQRYGTDVFKKGIK